MLSVAAANAFAHGLLAPAKAAGACAVDGSTLELCDLFAGRDNGWAFAETDEASAFVCGEAALGAGGALVCGEAALEPAELEPAESARAHGAGGSAGEV